MGLLFLLISMYHSIQWYLLKKNNNRMESLLDYVGLGKRIVKDDVDITNLPIVGYDVNATQLKLKSFRLESEKFLEDALAYN